MRHPAVTSVERGGAVDVSSDEGGLLFPHGVVPHPPDPTLRGEERSGRQKKRETERKKKKKPRLRREKIGWVRGGRGRRRRRQRSR